MRFALAAVLALGLAGTAAPGLAAQGDKAGIAGAVRGAVQLVSYQTPTATIGKKVASGDGIVLGDRIVTGPDAGLQIMLLDETTFTIGPNSSLVIDDFVYNPATGQGTISATVARGTFRFVSGKIARTQPENVNIKTPVAVIGIRGTTVVGRTDGQSLLVYLAGLGPNNAAGMRPSYIVIASGGSTCEIRREGFAISIPSPGGACSAAFRLPPADNKSLTQSTGLIVDLPPNTTDLPGIPGNTLPTLPPDIDKYVWEFNRNRGEFSRDIPFGSPTNPCVRRDTINLSTRTVTSVVIDTACF